MPNELLDYRTVQLWIDLHIERPPSSKISFLPFFGDYSFVNKIVNNQDELSQALIHKKVNLMIGDIDIDFVANSSKLKQLKLKIIHRNQDQPSDNYIMRLAL